MKVIPVLLLTVMLASSVFAAEDHSEHNHGQVTAPAVPDAHQGHGTMQESSPLASGLTFALVLMLIAGFILFFRGIQGKDFLEYSLVSKLMKSRLYPAILQVPTLIFFVFIIYFFFFGPLSYSQNPGSVLAWTLWWPLVPLTFILFGRIWCVVCPIPLVGEFFQKFISPTRRPGKFLVKYGIWITDGIFIAITLFDRLYGMVDTPWLSGAVFLFIIAGAIILSIRYERRTFCKHICFLGGVSGNYSMLSGISIETKNPETCATCSVKACFFGSGKAPGCPYFSTMPAKTTMRTCHLCANCIKNCPRDNIAIRARSIASELWSHAKVSFSESFFAKLMVGIVIIQNMGMLAIWANMTDFLMSYGIGEKAAIAVLYFAAIALPLLLMTITSFLSNRLQTEKGTTSSNFAAFGYAFIPIDVAGHLAHNLFHLFAEGKSIIGAFIGLFTGSVTMTGPLADTPIITGAQFALITAGGIGTLYVAYKIARAKEASTKDAIRIVLPHSALLLLVFAVNIFLFITPMAHRGG
ncbi:4Fe-4S binding protein [Candidatus Woesearchaeota archaeon]|nr:4Fe-4S binding protein [Candidatus Woesearchaeota archaeon]